MEEMSVSKLQVELAKKMAAAGDVVRFLDSVPRRGLTGLLVRNLWAVAHAAAHVVFRCLVRIQEEMLIRPVGSQSTLFDVPEDHAMTVRELESWIDAFKGQLTGSVDLDEDDEDDDPDGDDWTLNTPESIKRAVYTGEATTIDEIVEESGWSGADNDSSAVADLVRAMINLGELQLLDDGTLAASTESVSWDVVAMLAAQPELGTPGGLGEDEIQWKGLVVEGDEGDSDDDAEAFLRRHLGGYTDEVLRLYYIDNTGRKPGRKSAATLIDELVEESKSDPEAESTKDAVCSPT